MDSILQEALQQCVAAAQQAVKQLSGQGIGCPSCISLAAEQARLALRIASAEDDPKRWDERLKQPPLMPLRHAHDALMDLVGQFHNDALRRGIKELEPDQWLALYRGWIENADLARDYAETLRITQGRL